MSTTATSGHAIILVLSVRVGLSSESVRVWAGIVRVIVVGPNTARLCVAPLATVRARDVSSDTEPIQIFFCWKLHEIVLSP
jgi:hypothetical protein